jgi:hypothetical protein
MNGYHAMPPLEDRDFVQTTEVETDYERGFRKGSASRAALAQQVMEETMRMEREHVLLRKYLARFWFALGCLAAMDLIRLFWR